jgi:hypothetical protein
MTSYIDALNALVEEAEAALGISATRDPSAIPGLVSAKGGCVFVGIPVTFNRLLDGVNLDVPISIVAPAPGDLRAADWLLAHVDALVEFCQASNTAVRQLDVGDLSYPAIMVVARIAL